MDCIFCKIAQGNIPAKIIYQDDTVIAFDDLHPTAPIHKLIIPKKHIATLNDLSPQDEMLMGHIITVASKLANELGVADDGYRLVSNCNKAGGQAVFHIHFHLIGARTMAWPPG